MEPSTPLATSGTYALPSSSLEGSPASEMALDAEPDQVVNSPDGGSSAGSASGSTGDDGPPPSRQNRPFAFNRRAFLITAVIILILALLAGAVLLLASRNKKEDTKSPNNFAVSNLSVDSESGNAALQVGGTDQLTINGQLQVAKTLVVTPTATPGKPVAGQIYYNSNDNILYYYNGTQFVPMAPPPQSVTTLGGASGVIGLGNGLQMVGGQLSVTPAAAGVTSVQGQTGAVNFTPGQGISISGTTIGNTGLLGLAAGNGLSVTTSGGQATVGLSGPVSVANGGTGVNGSAYNTNGVFYYDGTKFVTTAAPSAANQCLMTTSGPPYVAAFSMCPGAGSGVTTVGSLNGDLPKSANGAKISGTTIFLQTADENFPGLVSIDAQTLAGVKTFNDEIIGKAGTTINGTINLNNSGSAVTNINVGSSGAVNIGNGSTGAIALQSGSSINLTGNAASTWSVGNNALTVSSSLFNVTNTGQLSVGNSGTAGQLSLYDGSSNTTTLQSGATASNLTFTLPTAYATNNLQCLKTTTAGAGTLVWGDCLSGGPGDGVDSLESLSGALTLSSGDGTIVITPVGTNIDLSAPNAGSCSTCANQQLSNLTGTTAISVDLLSNANNTINIGSNLNRFASGYFGGTLNVTGAGNFGSLAVDGNTLLVDAVNNRVAIGQSVAAAGAKLQVAGGASLVGTTSGSDANLEGTIIYDSASDTFKVYEGSSGTLKTLCNLVDGCGSGPLLTLQNAYSNYSSSPANIALNPTNGGVIINDDDPGIGGDLFTVANFDTSIKYLNVTASGISSSGTINGLTLSSNSLASSAATNLSIDAGTSGLLNLNNNSSGNILLGGGLGSTGCTLTNSTGAFACADTITVGTGGTASSLSTTQLTIGGNVVCDSLGCSAPGGPGLAKNAQDTSTFNVPAAGNLYVFTNNSSGVASGVLKLDNGSNTNSALTVTGSGTPGANQALIFASNTNAAPAGNLLDLQSGSAPTSKFSVNAAGNVLVAGTYNSNTFNGNTLTFGAASAATIQSATSQALNIDTGGGASLNLGNANTTTINLGANNAAHTINIGNGTAAQTVNLGSTDSTSRTVIQGGASGTSGANGGILLEPAGGSSNVGVLVRPTSNSTLAFVVQNTITTNLLAVDTTNSKVGVGLGPSPTGATLQVFGTLSTRDGFSIYDGISAYNTVLTGNAAKPILQNITLDVSGSNKTSTASAGSLVTNSTGTISLATNSTGGNTCLQSANNTATPTWAACPTGSGGWGLTGVNTGSGHYLGQNDGNGFSIISSPSSTTGPQATGNFITMGNAAGAGTLSAITISGYGASTSYGGGPSSYWFTVQNGSSSNVLLAASGGSTNQGLMIYAKTHSGGNNHLCTTSTGDSLGTLELCTGADIAERYNSTDSLVPGELVSVDAANYPNVVRGTAANRSMLMGIVSTQPNLTMDDGSAPNGYPIALTGRVPTKVNTEGGAIHAGDRITASSTPGVGKKAAPGDTVIGIALEDYSGTGTGTINVLLQSSYAAAADTSSYLQNGSNANFSDLNVSGNTTLNNLTVTGAATLASLQVTGSATIDGELHVAGAASFDGPTISFSSNVRGIGLAVPDGATSVPVSFETPHADADYAVQCTPSYNTNCYVTDKTTTGFTLRFGTAPPDGSQTVDWFVVR